MEIVYFTDQDFRACLGFFLPENHGTGQIYRSVNRGNSWSVVTNALSTSPFNNMCTTLSDHLFGGASGVYRSLDHGGIWNDMNPGLDARKPIVCFTGAANGQLYTGT